VARTASVLALFALLACMRKAELAGDETETQPSESSGTSSETETETETGDELPEDPCPATPELDSFAGVFDGVDNSTNYPIADWVETCTVSAHTGDLIAGESITLDCVTSEGLAVERVLEIQASLIDAAQPMETPVEVGEILQLTLQSEGSWTSFASWVLRDAEQLDDIRLIYYTAEDLFQGSSSPTPASVEPLAVTLQDDVCETFCPEPGGGFVPTCGCEREQALEFALGSDSAIIQNGSAGAIGTSMFAFVETAKMFTNRNQCSDFSDSWYTFIVVKR
jgi:hypothetical protein